jgi:hypothetical protein
MSLLDELQFYVDDLQLHVRYRDYQLARKRVEANLRRDFTSFEQKDYLLMLIQGNDGAYCEIKFEIWKIGEDYRWVAQAYWLNGFNGGPKYFGSGLGF